jgi:hypothetical protein
LGALTAALWSRMGFMLFHTVGPARGAEPSRKRWELLGGDEQVPPGWRDLQRRLALPPIILAVLALLAGVYFLLDRLVETRREQITRKLHEMAAAVRTQDLDRIFAHISEQFNVFGKNKAAFRDYVESRFSEVQELVVWDEQFPDDSGRVVFRAKPKGPRIPEQFQAIVHAEFVRDPDEQWRLRHFEIRFGLGNEVLPGLP